MPGGTGISCSDEKGSKVCATRAGHAFPERGERESVALAKEIAIAVNSHADMLAALKDLTKAYEALRQRAGYEEGDESDSLEMAHAAIAKAERA
ncbi:MAG: hypothetical protein EOS11_28755 [Mesorhizobium sp.]|nr:MAG: hypothetical protein EOS11_28755 [Mesorhizobium sp.]